MIYFLGLFYLLHPPIKYILWAIVMLIDLSGVINYLNNVLVKVNDGY
jgi:hypothetical protein